MEEVALYTRYGGYVATVHVPPFNPPAEIILWGERFFVRKDGRYLEGMCWVVMPTPPPIIVQVGICARCGKPLDNVSPGWSVTTGGAKVCTLCLRPGEELLRARGL